MKRGELFERFNLAQGAFDTAGAPDRNALAFNRIDTYLCPSSPIQKMELNAPHNPNTPELINGAAPYTTHYYGVIGPKGVNASTGQNYLTDPPATHGDYSRHGMFHWTNKPLEEPSAIPAEKTVTRNRSRGFQDVLDGTS